MRSDFSVVTTPPCCGLYPAFSPSSASRTPPPPPPPPPPPLPKTKQMKHLTIRISFSRQTSVTCHPIGLPIYSPDYHLSFLLFQRMVTSPPIPPPQSLLLSPTTTSSSFPRSTPVLMRPHSESPPDAEGCSHPSNPPS